MKKLWRRLKNEDGAIIVEATISLPVFIFAIVIILSIINMCYVQAKIGTALNAAAKEISEYSYLYYAFHGDEGEGWIMQQGGNVNSMFSNIDTIIDSGPKASSSASQGDVPGTVDAVTTGYDAASSLDDQIKAAANDPVAFIVGLFAPQIEDGINQIKGALGAAIGRGFMKKNLVEASNGDPDAFLKSMHVIHGIDGLHFDGTQWLPANISEGTIDGTIVLRVNYDVQILNLLGMNQTLHFSQVAESAVWGRGGASYKGGQ